MEYIRELTSRHGLQLSDATERAWMRFEDRRGSRFRPLNSCRKLLLEPHAQDRIPDCYQNTHIDVASRGVKGKFSLYLLPDVTGVDECVQAVVASQETTAICLLAAMEQIEEENLPQFSFVCHGATHRSVACCILLAVLTYPNALIRMTTMRTHRAVACLS